MVPPRRPPRLLVPRDVTETARQGQGIGDIEAILQSVAVPAKAAKQAFLDAGAQQRAVISKLATGQYDDPDVQDAMLDFAMPAAGTIKNVGREALERSRLVGRPMDFEAEKSALGRLLRAEAEKPLPPAMRDKPIIEGAHSSSRLFDRPRIDREVAGTGAGDYWQGPGFYDTTSRGPAPSVEAVYREETAFAPQLIQMPSGVVLDRDALMSVSRKLPTGDPRNASLTNLLTASDTYYDDADELFRQLKYTRAEASKAYKAIARSRGEDKTDARERFQDVMNALSEVQSRIDMRGNPRMEYRIPQDLRQATYNVQFAASPDELFDLQRSAADQPASERILAALRGMSNPVRQNESLADAVARMERAGMPAYEVNERLVGNKYQGAADMFSGLDRFELMNELNARGVVGNQYLTKLAAENPNLPRTFNYVIQDPSRVRLTDVWAAAPIGLALNAADRQQRKQEPQAKR